MVAATPLFDGFLAPFVEGLEVISDGFDSGSESSHNARISGDIEDTVARGIEGPKMASNSIRTSYIDLLISGWPCSR